MNFETSPTGRWIDRATEALRLSSTAIDATILIVDVIADDVTPSKRDLWHQLRTRLFELNTKIDVALKPF